MTPDHPLPAHLFAPAAPCPLAVRFRLATDSDMGSLYALFYAHQPLPRFHDHFRRIVTQQPDKRSFWLVGELGTQLVGNCQLIIYPHGAEIANLGVRPEFRHCGIGTAMISVMTAIARHIGLKSLEIGVDGDNNRAKALYQRLGFAEDRRFRPVAERTAIILRKEL